MRAFVRPVLGLAALLAVAGCDVFGPGTETLEFRPLIYSDTFVTGEPEPIPLTPGGAPFNDISRSRVIVFRSASDIDAFRATYTVSEPFPDIDFATESIVGYFLRDNEGDASIDIREIELKAEDTLLLTCDYGGTGVSPRDLASRFVVQLVAVPRLESPIVTAEARRTSD